MFQPPAPRPRTAHLPLLSAVTSGPPCEPFVVRSLILAPAIGFPVFLSTMYPARRLLPRQSSAANADTATMTANIAVAMVKRVFFMPHKKNCPPEEIPRRVVMGESASWRSGSIRSPEGIGIRRFLQILKLPLWRRWRVSYVSLSLFKSTRSLSAPHHITTRSNTSTGRIELPPVILDGRLHHRMGRATPSF